jgi:hypothetical protein
VKIILSFRAQRKVSKKKHFNILFFAAPKEKNQKKGRFNRQRNILFLLPTAHVRVRRVFSHREAFLKFIFVKLAGRENHPLFSNTKKIIKRKGGRRPCAPGFLSPQRFLKVIFVELSGRRR